mmetsp:Transcript_45031/g.111837  ORF Transcript_45031/g.111837 Transcript_45031/m.111837 type:complete len:101 (-) Transcript_45031:1377-1679(-)
MEEKGAHARGGDADTIRLSQSVRQNLSSINQTPNFLSSTEESQDETTHSLHWMEKTEAGSKGQGRTAAVHDDQNKVRSVITDPSNVMTLVLANPPAVLFL